MIVTAAKILARVPSSLVEYPLWRPGCDPAQAPWPGRQYRRAPCGTESARKRHRKWGEECGCCTAAHAARHPRSAVKP